MNAYIVHLAYELKDTPFKVSVVDPGWTKTDFNRHNGPGKVEDAAAIVVKHTTIGQDGPTRKFFSQDIETTGQENPW
ncbi:hypothetical protein ACFS5N_02500 [Mucilaginibacter ximonensis]|uniref:Uncharacterized protein n=1 Tax=Mucilaginibacter ximonensis TaxID=538021 RepID=A0ABW5Y972_9SPHI